MLRCAVLVPVLVLAAPALTLAQSLDPKFTPNPVAAGADVTATLACTSGESKASTPPAIVIDSRTIAARGESPKWTFSIPADFKAGAFSVKWKCGAVEAGKEPDAGTLTITAATGQMGQRSASPSPAPEVVGATNVSKGVSVTARPGEPTVTLKDVVLKNVLTLHVKNLESWRKDNQAARLHLFLAGAELTNVVAGNTSGGPGDPAETLALRLTPEVDEEDLATRKLWVQVLQAAKAGKTLEISLGEAGKAPFTSHVSVTLDVYPFYTTWAVILLYVFIAFQILRLGRNSLMLRDSNGSPNPPYSLAKHQMAAWFIVVLGAYLYIYITTGLFSTVSATALTLMGISGATGLVAVTMDASKRTDAAQTRTALTAERDALVDALDNRETGLRVQLAAATPGSSQAAELSSAVTAKLTRLEELKKILAVPVPPPASSTGWVYDLVSDDEGVSFHRVQMAAWTLVLALIFILQVRSDLLMPVFGDTLLGLMGISSGTYLGFKFPEKAS